MNDQPYNPETVEIGDLVEWWVRSYQHRATVVVTRVLKMTFEGIEIKGSYGGPISEEEAKTTHSHLYARSGRTWRVHKRADGLRRPYHVHQLVSYLETKC